MTPTATSPLPTPAPITAKNGSVAAPKAAAAPAAGGPPLVELYKKPAAGEVDNEARLRSAIVQGLKGEGNYIVPGDVNSKEDRKWAFKRTLPTEVLYSERGLQIYDELVEEHEYYLWRSEIDILTKYAPEIALRMFGHSTNSLRSNDDASNGAAASRPREAPKHEHNGNEENSYPPNARDMQKEKWGDYKVGKHNGGVNAEEGLDGQRAVGQASLIELGAGSLRKTIHLIRALQLLRNTAAASHDSPVVDYYALDLDRAELVRTLEELHAQEAKASDKDGAWTVLDGAVGLHGMWATYDQGLDFIGAGGLAPTSGAEEGQRCFLWLGSSIGNFDRRGAAGFLERLGQAALRAGDTLLVSVDRRNKPEAVAAAYHDSNGTTTSFIMQGIEQADKILGGGILSADAWEYHDRYNAVEGRHESYYRSLRDQELKFPGEAEPVRIEAGELVQVEQSYKYSEAEILDVFDQAGLRVIQRWSNDAAEKDADAPQYDMWLVESSAFHFASTRPLTGSRQDQRDGLSAAQSIAARGSWEFDADGDTGANAALAKPRAAVAGTVPTKDEWNTSWAAWNTVTLSMISHKMLHEKPIDLRHVCLFYLGHIPAFLDIMLCKVTGEAALNAHFSAIFERGIDIGVDDGEHCNPHSEVPQRQEDWPTLEEIKAYQDEVRKRVEKVYGEIASGECVLNRRLARTLWMTLEHNSMHMETLLYMLVQSDNTRPPAGFSAPDWASLVRQWEADDKRAGGEAARTALLHFKAAAVTLGHDDDESQDEHIVARKPTADVADLNAQINANFGWDNETPQRSVETGAFSIAASPVNNEQYFAYMKANNVTVAPASWVGSGDAYKVRTVYGPVDFSVARLWPVQASGEQLSAYATWKGGRLPTQAELRRFLDATDGPNITDRPGSNVGFSNWHPVPPQLARVETDGSVLAGHNGGVWEWTSSVLAKYDGWRESVLYPGYASDFFDERHNIVLGGSWATTPAIAGRTSMVNYYQFKYPYAFIGARVTYDANTPTKAGRSHSPGRA